MYLITFVAIIILISNSAFCYLYNGNMDVSVLPKMVNFPLDKTAEFEENDRSVYDPGVGHKTDQSNVNVAESLDPNIQTSQQILSFDNRLNSNEQEALILDKLKEDIKEEEDITMKSALLLQLLEKSTMDSPLPLLYVENQPTEAIDNDALYQTEKRSGRYYRRYPWKRQNNKYRASHSKYEADARYLCVPSRDEVFKLLVGLHENRNGNHQRTINFCNRKRPAKAIFTNIRFLG